ncbi:aldo/keto reductase [Marinobacter sp. C2H3]|uniref:aldo/keto reductase n=1 Tax=Marinobacter sp. C2H3 TaxID=3119003 RepID=UPI00300EB3EF
MTTQPLADPFADVSLIPGLMRLLDYPELQRPKALARWIERRLEQGLSLFDHADIYGNGECERLFGAALAAAPALRDRVRLITKADIVPAGQDDSLWGVKHYRACARYLTDALERSLDRLQVSQVDTFLIHRPDPLMEADDVARALERLVRDGKVRHIGVSNFLPEQWRWLQRHTSLPLVCNQAELSLAHTAPLLDGRHEAMQQDGLRWLAWSPLGGGQLADRLPKDLLARAREETGLCLTGLATAWIRRLPGAPVPVLGSLRDERIDAALAGCHVRLSRTLWFRLLEASRGQPVA